MENYVLGWHLLLTPSLDKYIWGNRCN